MKQLKNSNVIVSNSTLYPRKMLKLKGHDSVIPEESFQKVFTATNELDDLCADGYFTARHTGLRENELFGLSLADFFPGAPKDKVIQKKCDLHGLKPFGYIILESQPVNSLKIRDHNGRVKRKPLKHKDSISYENSRVIPILNKDTFNILAKRWNEQRVNHKLKHFGEDRKDYLLFDGLNKNRYYNTMVKAYEKAKVAYHSPHDTRHTFCTEMARLTNCDMYFCQLILGHTDQKTTERYWHISETIQKNLKSEMQLDENIKFVV